MDVFFFRFLDKKDKTSFPLSFYFSFSFSFSLSLCWETCRSTLQLYLSCLQIKTHVPRWSWNRFWSFSFFKFNCPSSSLLLLLLPMLIKPWSNEGQNSSLLPFFSFSFPASATNGTANIRKFLTTKIRCAKEMRIQFIKNKIKNYFIVAYYSIIFYFFVLIPVSYERNCTFSLSIQHYPEF